MFGLELKMKFKETKSQKIKKSENQKIKVKKSVGLSVEILSKSKYSKRINTLLIFKRRQVASIGPNVCRSVCTHTHILIIIFHLILIH